MALERAREAAERRARRRPVARRRNGRWRPDTPFTGTGLRVSMRRERGVTKGDVLRVPMRFQVGVLNEFSRPFRYNWATYDTLRVGQRSRPMGRQLLELSIDTMLLDDVAAASSEGLVIWDGEADPQGIIRELRWIMGDLRGSEPQVFRLVMAQPGVWGGTPLVNMLAVLTSLQPSQRQGEMGTEYLSATFLEYPEDESLDRKQRRTERGAKRHRLREGDTLYEIAKKHFHRPSAWKAIAKANGIKGVSPNDAGELAKWAKRHHKKELKIPAKSG